MQPTLYLDRGTPVHRLDPRAKLVALTAAFFVAMCFNHPAYLAGVWALVFTAGAAARALRNVWSMRSILALLFVFASLLWPLFLGRAGPGPAVTIGPFTISRAAFLYGLAMGLRFTAMVIAGLVFISATMVEEFAAGLRRMGVPFAVSFALSTAFRLVPTFLGGAASVVQAQRSRGLDLESGSPLSRLRKHLPLLVPVFVTAIRSTDLLAMALESKGFGAAKRRTEYVALRLRAADWLVAILALGLAGVALWWRLAGHGAVLPRL
jgi:energy-coupling factor transport system permease protein